MAIEVILEVTVKQILWQEMRILRFAVEALEAYNENEASVEVLLSKGLEESQQALVQKIGENITSSELKN